MTGNCGAMLKKALAITAIFLTMPLVSASQKAKSNPPKKPALTEEDREILKNRDILENMEILKDLEKFRFLELFADGWEPETKKESKKPEKEPNEKKAK
jgi:hypothetical protein